MLSNNNNINRLILTIKSLYKKSNNTSKTFVFININKKGIHLQGINTYGEKQALSPFSIPLVLVKYNEINYSVFAIDLLKMETISAFVM